MNRVKLLFAWYDLWIGFFWDSKKKLLYFFPIPMIGFVINIKYSKTNTKQKCNICGDTLVNQVNSEKKNCVNCGNTI